MSVTLSARYCLKRAVIARPVSPHYDLKIAILEQTVHRDYHKVGPKSSDHREVKSFMDVPEKKYTFGLLGASYKYLIKEKGQWHKLFKEDAAKYGPVFKEKIRGVYQVHITEAHALQDAMQQMDKFPQKPHYVHSAWQHFRHQAGESYALLTSENEEWYKYRHALSDKMLKTDVTTTFDIQVNKVISDFVKRLEKLQDSDLTIPNLTNEFYKWAMETVCYFLFEKRLGILSDPMPPRSQEFVDSVAEMLATSMFLGMFTEIHIKLNTKVWRRHSHAWQTIFDVARDHFNEKMNEITEQHKSDSPQLSGGAFLSRVIGSDQLTPKEIYANVCEIMLAGVDTTSNTICFALVDLANNPNIQIKLQQEVDTVLAGRVPTAQDLPKLPYLKMVIKESMRKNAVVPLFVRMISRDVVIGGYHIPASSPLLLHTGCASNDPKVFEDPHVFRPERWDRSNPKAMPHPFASLPFAYGVRGCIGRRLAELELHLLLARITQTFDVLPSDRYELKPEYRAILTPGENLPLQFVKRK